VSNKKQAPGFTVHPTLQKIFLALTVSAFVLQAGQILYWMIRQYPSNHNLSGYLVYGVYAVVAPLALFLMSFYLLPRTSGRLASLFRAALLTTMGIVAMGTLSQLTVLFYQRFIVLGGGYWQSAITNLAPCVLVLVLYPALLLALKRGKIV